MRDLPLLLRHPQRSPNTPAGRFGSAEAGAFAPKPPAAACPAGALPSQTLPKPSSLPALRPLRKSSPQKSRPHRDGFSSPYFAFPARMISRTVSSTTAAASRLMTAEATG